MKLVFKVLIIIGIILSLIIVSIAGFIFWLSYSIEEGSCSKYLEVPVNITVSGSNLNLNPLNSYSGQPEIFVYTYSNEKTIPKNCSIDSFYFAINGRTVYDKFNNRVGTGSTKPYMSGSWIREKYPTTQSEVFIFWINEPDNKQGAIRKTFLLGNQEFYIKTDITPFTEIEQIHYDYYQSLGCSSFAFPIELNLTLRSIQQQEIELNPRQIICVKKISNEPGTVIDRDSTGCSFFEATSNIKINVDVLEDMAVEGKSCRPIF